MRLNHHPLLHGCFQDEYIPAVKIGSKSLEKLGKSTHSSTAIMNRLVYCVINVLVKALQNLQNVQNLQNLQNVATKPVSLLTHEMMR